MFWWVLPDLFQQVQTSGTSRWERGHRVLFYCTNSIIFGTYVLPDSYKLVRESSADVHIHEFYWFATYFMSQFDKCPLHYDTIAFSELCTSLTLRNSVHHQTQNLPETKRPIVCHRHHKIYDCWLVVTCFKIHSVCIFNILPLTHCMNVKVTGLNCCLSYRQCTSQGDDIVLVWFIVLINTNSKEVGSQIENKIHPPEGHGTKICFGPHFRSLSCVLKLLCPKAQEAVLLYWNIILPKICDKTHISQICSMKT